MMEPLCVHVWTVACLSLWIGNTADAAASSVASFNDSRCAAGGVCPTDPLLFTCELNGVFILRVMLPNGYQDFTAVGDTAADIALPAGFTAEVLNINDETKNISLTLSIAHASLLDGGEMRCDDTIVVMVMAGCPLLGPPAPPYNLVQSSNTMNTATITWNMTTETDATYTVTYTVTSTSLMSRFSGIEQKSYILRNLEVETDYIVSVTATNECGDESQPSEEITVRINVPGDGDGGDSGGSGKMLSTAVVSGTVGGGVVVAIIGGGTCLLLIFLFKKKTRTTVEEQKIIFMSPLPGPASPIMKDNPVDCSGDVDPTHQDHITTVDNSHQSGSPVQVVKDSVAVSNGMDSTYSVITDLHITDDHETDAFGYSSVTVKESSLAEFGRVDPTFLESDNTTQTLNPSQPSSASPVKEETTAGEMDPTYNDVITITHSPHPTTGVLYTDVNVKTKKMVQMTAEVDDGSIY